MRRVTIFVILPLLFFVSTSCETINTAIKDIKENLDISGAAITSDEALSILQSAKEVTKSFEDITPEQEYYISRAVGAVILNKYPVWVNEKANSYINLLGQTLAMASDRPELFGGYHFLILDSDEINAFAAPGGHIFITRGMIRLTDNEDMLAAVLSHEIGHIVNKHGLKAIKQTRITSALGKMAATAMDSIDNNMLGSLTEDFKASIGDIADTLITDGYSRVNEFDADKEAVLILKRTGYDPAALIDLLKKMESHLVPGHKGFYKTHPDPEERIKLASVYSRRNKTEPYPKSRIQRFNTFLAGI